MLSAGIAGLAILIATAATQSAPPQALASSPMVYEFTNAGATGSQGPTQAAVNSAYSGTNLANSVTVTDAGVQEWVVPFTGTYRLTVAGAHGAAATGASNDRGGRGALITTERVLEEGTRLWIVVGQAGSANANNGGGGGASFVTVGSRASTTGLIVAGGGGGTRTAATANGGDASIKEWGLTTGSAYNSGSAEATRNNTLQASGMVFGGDTPRNISGSTGWTDVGYGGVGPASSYGDGGAGWSGDGHRDAQIATTRAVRLGSGASPRGGIDPDGSSGGFGGGGAGRGGNGGGGGGGYTGGDGGHVAGGGGSFVASGYSETSIGIDVHRAFARNGTPVHGYVTITPLLAVQSEVTASLSATSAVYGDTVTVTAGGGSGTGAYSVSLSANESCTISGETVTITAGAGACAVVVTRGGDEEYAERSSAAQTITVAPRPVTVTGAGAVTRPYDGTTTVAVTAGTLSGALDGDSLTLTSPTNGTADSAEVGTHDVSATFTLSGASAADYALTQPSLSVTIEQRVLTLGVARIYDGTTEVDLSSDAVSALLANLVHGESLTLAGVGSITSPDASAEARTLTLGTIAIGDAEAGAGTAANYVLAPSGHTATIDRRPLSSSGSRVYDGSAEIGAGELTLEGFAVGEAVGLTGSATAASADVGRVPADTNVTVVGAAEGLPSFEELRVIVTTQAPGRLWLTSSTGLQAITGYPLPTTQAGGQAAIGLRGPRAAVVAALANDLRFRTSSAGDYQVTVEASAGDVTAFASTDGARYYRVISGGFASWSAARDAAENETITLKDGSTASGYLATITSAAENEFIRQYVSATSWIGASDEFATVNAVLPAGTTPYANQAASEGRWYWVTGPEAGTRFSEENFSPVAVAGRFNAWASGEPNNSGGEHCGEFYTSGQWNDIPCGASGKPAIVEFGPFPASQDITTTIVVQLGREPQDIVDLTALTLVDGSGGVLASNYTLDGGTHTFTFLPRPVRGSFAAVNRVFDGTLAASVLDGSRALAAAAGSPEGTGVVATDVGLVTLTGGTATFDATSIGPRTATLSGATLGGARAANYVLDGVDPAAAAITARLLTIASAGTFEVYGGAGRIYDGSRTATITSWDLALDGIAVGDTVILEPVAEFVTAGAGLDKEVRISASSVLSGPDAGNYTLDVTGAPTATASITPRPVTVTGASVAARPYDGTTAVTITGATLANTVAGDAVSLANATSGVAASRDAGTRAVSTSMTLAGADAANYTLTGQPSVSVTITPLPVSVTMNALPARPYDGTTALPLTSGAFTVSGVLAGESIGVSGTARLSSRVAGTRVVTLASPTFTPGAGTNLANYTLPGSVSGTVTVTPAPLTVVGATVTQRPFDGTTAATVTGARLEGVRGGDNVSLTGAGTGVFASSQPGTHAVAFSPTLVGVDASSYTLVVPALSGTIVAAPATLRITGGLTQFADGSPRSVRAAVSPAGVGRITITYPGGSAPSAPGSYPVTVTLDSATHTAQPLSSTITIQPVEALVLPGLTATNGTTGTTGTGANGATTPEDQAAAERRREALIARIAVRTDGTLALPEIGPVLEVDGSAPAFAPREHRVLEDGEPSTARIVVVEEQRVRVETDDASLALELQASVSTPDGRVPLPVDADGTLLLDRGGFVEVGGSGFLAGSTAEVWMFSTATFLGTAIVDADGSFEGAFLIDDLLAAGEHTIQLNGTGADQRVRSTSLGVRIDDPENPSRERVVLASTTDTGIATTLTSPLWLALLAALLGAGVTRWWIAGRRRRDEDEDAGAGAGAGVAAGTAGARREPTRQGAR